MPEHVRTPRKSAHRQRSALARFRELPAAEVEQAVDVILAAHLAVAAAGYLPVDLYDGCFLYDFDARRMRLIDLDEYRPGPFVLHSDRLSGSRRYMAPEELIRGSVIDERTGVHLLGRALHHLLDAPGGWRGSAAQQEVVRRATRPDPARRPGGMAELVDDWRTATRAPVRGSSRHRGRRA